MHGVGKRAEHFLQQFPPLRVSGIRRTRHDVDLVLSNVKIFVYDVRTIPLTVTSWKIHIDTAET